MADTLLTIIVSVSATALLMVAIAEGRMRSTLRRMCHAERARRRMLREFPELKEHHHD